MTTNEQPPPEPPVCRYCGGRGWWIGGDEEHVCWCQQPDADAAAKELAL